MADYSYVKVDFSLPTSEEADDFAWEHLTRATAGEATLTFPDENGASVAIRVVLPGEGTTFEAVFEEARYGFDCDVEVVALCRWLTERQVEWRAYDGGGYEWPPAEHEWHPGDDRYRSRELGNSGGPVLSEQAWQEAVEVSGGNAEVLHCLIEGHFGRDHHGWLQATTPEHERAG